MWCRLLTHTHTKREKAISPKTFFFSLYSHTYRYIYFFLPRFCAARNKNKTIRFGCQKCFQRKLVEVRKRLWHTHINMIDFRIFVIFLHKICRRFAWCKWIKCMPRTHVAVDWLRWNIWECVGSCCAIFRTKKI